MKIVTNGDYRFTELYNQLKRGPHPDEDFFRLQIQGEGKTNWINISTMQLCQIALIVGRDD